MAKILLIDTQEQRRQGLASILVPPHEVVFGRPGADITRLIHDHQPDLLMIALKLEGASGIDLLKAARKLDPAFPAVIIVTDKDEAKDERSQLDDSKGDRLLRADCLIGPFTVSAVHEAVNLALSKKQHSNPRSAAGNAEASPFAFAFEGMVGSSPAMREVFRLILKMADAPGPVLVLGERGTGKESVVRHIHQIRQLKKGGGLGGSPGIFGELEVIRCASMSAPRLERLLFGYARGAFPGALREHLGLFERAQGGALYLDDVDALPAWLQPRLLRVLEEHRVRRLGDDLSRPVTVDFFAAGGANVPASLQPDFFYFLGTNTVRLPPLREHLGDVPQLVEHFLAKYRTDQPRSAEAGAAEAGQTRLRGGERKVECTTEAMNVLMNYAWPGNIGELKYAIDQAARVCDDNLIKPGNLPEAILSDVRRRGIVHHFFGPPNQKG